MCGVVRRGDGRRVVSRVVGATARRRDSNHNHKKHVSGIQQKRGEMADGVAPARA
jgi:hypothetical protein